MITNKSVLITYLANGTSKQFSFPFKIYSADELKVSINGKEIQTTFIIEYHEDVEGGMITFETAPVTNSEVSIKRVLDITRKHDFQSGGSFRAEDINQELDYQTLCLQQVNYELGNAMKFGSDVEDQDIDLTVPEPKAGCMMVWNKTENGLELRNADLIIEASNEAHDYATICQDMYDAMSTLLGTSETAGLAGKIQDILTFLNNKFPEDFDDNGEIKDSSLVSNDLGEITEGDNGGI
ncbi:MAG: phage tail fiber protein [Alphaproteobacteria bacterium]|jgi:hypothetical protein|nr:phage tail fiber protein [Alphaproteobacteria bacterium]